MTQPTPPLARFGLTLIMLGTTLLLREQARAAERAAVAEAIEPEPVFVFGPITISSEGVASDDATPTPRPRPDVAPIDATPTTSATPEPGNSPAQPGT